MATTALGIMQDSDGNGVSPLTHRKIIQARWSNTGVITGLEVSGGSDMRYTVSAGCAVVSRSDSDGFAEAYWEGGTTESVSSGDPSNPRIDSIWIKANDKQQGDPDNLVHVGVTSGSASESPVAPDVPAGCTEIARMTVPAGASSTSSAEITSETMYAIPYGSNLGLLAEYVNTYEGRGDPEIRKWYVENLVSVTVPTDRIVEVIYTGTMANDPPEGWISWAICAFQLDGQDIEHSGCEWQASNGVWEDHTASIIINLPKGTHTIAVRNGMSSSSDPGTQAPYFRYSDNYGITYKGRILQVWDRGVG